MSVNDGELAVANADEGAAAEPGRLDQGTLCLCLACLCFPRETKNPWPFVLALAGAAFTSTYALIVASALGFAWWTILLLPIGKSASQTETPSVPASPAPAAGPLIADISGLRASVIPWTI